MSTAKCSIITIAAAMVVNLTPLGEALEAAASVNPLNLNDDFPPLIDTSLRTDGGGVTCHYSNEKTMEKAPKSWKFRLERDSVAETDFITCPRRRGIYFNFRSDFGFDSNVPKRIYYDFPQFNYREASQLYEFEDPLEATDLDPLRNISASAYSRELESVSSAAKEMEKPVGSSGEWMPHEALFGMANGMNTLRDMREACSAAVKIIKNQYPTFTETCDEYWKVTNGTIQTAIKKVRSKEWRLTITSNVNKFSRISGQGVFGALLNKFGF
ncbi:hypothetical protein FOZ62_028973 [Perkinsus olseni]|uniref:Uncharacterized protein n=2 Tax=Perkinsus olseni TaxID=32597 RepID=A0A7J6RGB0_PEROL|nr:hypothetical protein FOZ62_028973 [Perkinsus olseni]